MAQESTDQKSDTSALGAGLGVLERAWDAQWALRLACALLFFDMAMLLHFQRGVWQWPEVGKKLLDEIGWLVVVFVAFSVVAAIVAPVFFIVLRHCCAFVMGLLPDRWVVFLTPVPSDIRQALPGEVPVKEFHDLALQEKDEFLYRIYEQDQQRKQEQRHSLERLGDLVAAVLVAGFANWLLGRSTPGGIGLVSATELALGNRIEIVTLVVVFCASLMLKLAWFPRYEPNRIYYPPLARELRDNEHKSRGVMSKKSAPEGADSLAYRLLSTPTALPGRPQRNHRPG